jgi:hypothetical protein
MTPRGTLRLALVLGLLLLVAWLAERPAREPEATPPLCAVAAAAVASIAWTDGGVMQRVMRDAGGWRTPAGGAVRRDVADDLVAALTTLSPLRAVDAGAGELAQYGIDADARHLRLLDAAGTAHCDITVGRRNPAATNLYVQRDGDPRVLVVGAQLDWEFTKLRDATPRP